MTEMNQDELGDLDADIGASLDLDDESLFAELDTEVLLDDSPAPDGERELDISADADDLDLGEPSSDLDDLDLGEPSGELDELDLGESPASEDGLDDLDIGGEGLEELDLGESGDGLDDLLDDKPAAADSPEELPQLELDAGEESLDLDSDSDVQLDSDMEALDLSLDEDSLGDLDAGADDLGQEISDESLEELPPAEDENIAAVAEGEAVDDVSLDDLQVESLEEPSEPVFDLDSFDEAPAAAESMAEAEELSAAPDVKIDEQPLDLELDEISGMMTEEETEETEPDVGGEESDAGEEVIELEPAGADIQAEEEFVAADDVDIDRVDLEAEETEFVAVDDVDIDEVELEAVEQEIEPEAEVDFVAVEDVDMDDDALDLGLEEVEPANMAMPEPVATWEEIPEIKPEPQPASEELEVPVTPMAEPPSAPPEPPPAPALANKILMSISHQVSVELGSVSLNGQDLMDLSYGSIVPINRVVGEPVDLMLEGKAIAQGEIVLINGKDLGVRIVAVSK
ncbi:MAG: FliM/FliN family flagellar motor switch protein [SAR324 cluster bacterium]|nr:FliM/FliN family flagellar motor switch protein [SAR324 cluster bacterium]